MAMKQRMNILLSTICKKSNILNRHLAAHSHHYFLIAHTYLDTLWSKEQKKNTKQLAGGKVPMVSNAKNKRIANLSYF